MAFIFAFSFSRQINKKLSCLIFYLSYLAFYISNYQILINLKTNINNYQKPINPEINSNDLFKIKIKLPVKTANNKSFISNLTNLNKYGGCSLVAEYGPVASETGVRFSPTAYNSNKLSGGQNDRL